MIEAIEWGLRNEHGLKEQAQIAREEVRRQYRWKDVASRTREAYARALRS